MFDWNDLRIFLAVARNGSALAAAQKLNLNQTTVTRRMDALEHALGICLFLRDTRGSTLTPQGSHLLLHAEAVESAARAFDGEAGRLRRDLSGEICVTAPEVIMAQFIGPLTQNFRTLHPEIRFAYLSAEHHLDLAKGEADVAFRAGSEIVGDTFVRVALPDVIWSAYCSERYRDKSGMPDRVADLRQHSIVTYGTTLVNLPAIAFFMMQTDPLKIVATSNSVPNMCSVLRAGLGVGLLPCFLGDLQPGIIRCFPPAPEMRTPWWIVASQDAYQLPRVRSFMSFAAEEIRRDRALLQGRIHAPSSGSKAPQE